MGCLQFYFLMSASSTLSICTGSLVKYKHVSRNQHYFGLF
uniref:Uncharacterized protein n=1 Tax=Rhizophora mucronata TaxID=61149 RepID=A0A2P2NLV3_RHIMU